MVSSVSSSTAGQVWRFFRAGGFDQVQLDTGADLVALEALDQKLWVALSCPVAGVEFDRRTLELIDTDHDGHIRVPEILTALAWLKVRLKDPGLLLKGVEAVPLVAIDDGAPEGAQLLASARTILASLGKTDSDIITCNDVSDTEQIFARTRFNGDGIVTAASTDKEDLKTWIGQLIDCLGGEVDRSGDPGINTAKVEQFSNEAAAWLAWQDAVLPDAAHLLPEVSREAAIELWAGVKDKLEDYFLRCRLAAYDERAAVTMNAAEEQLQALAARNLAEAGEEIA
ncbi:MAG TPA: hypothetical protein VIU41_07995, partial [Geobacteraceae bacterium]